jgi:hypothetical protein
MDPSFRISGNDAQTIAVFAVAWSVVVMFFWMVTGWRAMRAHERMADAIAYAAREVRYALKASKGSLPDDGPAK